MLGVSTNHMFFAMERALRVESRRSSLAIFSPISRTRISARDSFRRPPLMRDRGYGRSEGIVRDQRPASCIACCGSGLLGLLFAGKRRPRLRGRTGSGRTGWSCWCRTPRVTSAMAAGWRCGTTLQKARRPEASGMRRGTALRRSRPPGGHCTSVRRLQNVKKHHCKPPPQKRMRPGGPEDPAERCQTCRACRAPSR